MVGILFTGGVGMEEILRKVSTANEEETEMLLTAVLARYGELYPDWEISTISLLRGEDRAEQLDRTIRMLEYMKKRQKISSGLSSRAE